VLLLTVLFATVSFYAIHDPAISPDVSKIMLTSNKRSWAIGQTLAQYASQDVSYHIDQRVSMGFGARILKDAPQIFMQYSKVYLYDFVILGSDEIGSLWANYKLNESLLQKIKTNNCSRVFTDGMYTGYLTKRE
jgi:hypothetical protein